MVDLLALLSRMLSRTVAREFMTPLLQRFFSCFDGIYQLERKPSGESDIVRKFSGTEEGYMDAKMSEDSRIEGGSAQAPSTGSATNEYTQSDVVDKRPFNESEGRENNKYQDYDETERSSLYKDLYDTFTPSLAYYSYVLFCRVLGDYYMESTLYNSELIWQLCTNHDERLTLTDQTEKESTATVILNSDLGSIAAEVRGKDRKFYLLFSS